MGGLTNEKINTIAKESIVFKVKLPYEDDAAGAVVVAIIVDGKEIFNGNVAIRKHLWSEITMPIEGEF